MSENTLTNGMIDAVRNFRDCDPPIYFIVMLANGHFSYVGYRDHTSVTTRNFPLLYRFWADKPFADPDPTPFIDPARLSLLKSALSGCHIGVNVCIDKFMVVFKCFDFVPGAVKRPEGLFHDVDDLLAAIRAVTGGPSSEAA